MAVAGAVALPASNIKPGAPIVAVPKPAAIDEFGGVYGVLIDKMRANRFSTEEINSSLEKLEAQVEELHDMFGGLDLDRFTIRKWLADTISKEIYAFQRRPYATWAERQELSLDLSKSEDFDILSRVKIGRAELRSLLRANHENLGFFKKMASSFPVFEITEKAFDALFGDQNGKYEVGKDVVSLARFTNTMKDKVLVVTGTISSNALQKAMEYFASNDFVFMDKDMMVDRVKIDLYNLAVNNIVKKYSPSNDSRTGNKEKREELIKQVKFHIYGKAKDGKKPDIVRNLWLKAGKGKGLDDWLDYFEGYEKKALFGHMISKYNNELFSGRSESEIDENEILCLAGLAALCSEASGFVSHLEATGGKAKDIYGPLGKKREEKVKKELEFLIDDAAVKFGLNGYNGGSLFGLDGPIQKGISFSRSVRNNITNLTDEQINELYEKVKSQDSLPPAAENTGNLKALPLKS
jgi:hypothetical protein